jgi:hypothetical protein
MSPKNIATSVGLIAGKRAVQARLFDAGHVTEQLADPVRRPGRLQHDAAVFLVRRKYF